VGSSGIGRKREGGIPGKWLMGGGLAARKYFSTSCERDFLREAKTRRRLRNKRINGIFGASTLWRSYEIDYLTVVAPVDAEVRTVNREYPRNRVQLTHHDDRRVGQIHSLVACH